MGILGLYNSVLGLRAHDFWLDGVGNNLSNVNTVGFKASRVTFSDALAVNLRRAVAPRASQSGGVNSLSVGTGVHVGSVFTRFTQGPILQSPVATDLAIEGSGFFLVERGGEQFLTRSGGFDFDAEGFLTAAGGARVLGINATTDFSRKVINTQSSVPGQPAVVTDASLKLDEANVNNIQPIRIAPNMVLPPKATTEIRFKGNLDSFQQATDPGGILNLFPGGNPILPLGLSIAVFGPAGLNPNKAAPFVLSFPPLQFALQQVDDLTVTNFGPNPKVADPVVLGGINIGFVRSFNTYAWDQNPPVPPASELSTTVYDSQGNPREVTIQFYQVMDLGNGGINSPGGPSQAAYAWYAFETTGGQAPATSNLLGGTGIYEGDLAGAFGFGYDRGMLGNIFIGDLIYFNTDGSLASAGATFGVPPGNPFGVPPTPAQQIRPRIYLPPLNSLPPVSPIPTFGAEILAIDLNFGTFGTLTNGRRDGLFSDAQGEMQVVNGVTRYVPNHSAYIESQDGYPDGFLLKVEVNTQGVIRGFFSNGEQVELAKVLLGTVSNPEGLSRAGDGFFRLSANAGSLRVLSAGRNGAGIIRSFALEGSNVDLAVELTQMLLAQRGFQSNARVFQTISREMATLTNLGLR